MQTRGMNEFEVLAWSRMRDHEATGLVCRDDGTVWEWHGNVYCLDALQRELEDYEDEILDWDAIDADLAAIIPTGYVDPQYGDQGRVEVPGSWEWKVVVAWDYDELFPEINGPQHLLKQMKENNEDGNR